MKTKTIFKTLAFAMMMPAMLLTTACSSDDDSIINNNESTNKNGYTIPVTINVTRQDDANTRAIYSGNKLSFSSGDKLFVKGTHSSAGKFAGTLDYVPASGNFSGTITMQNNVSTTADALLTGASTKSALLLPDGYIPYSYFTPSGSDYSADVSINASNAFTALKATAVEQFSFEHAYAYSDGFALAPQNAILYFTISGLTASATDIAVSLTGKGALAISNTVNADGSGNATFAVGIDVTQNDDLDDLTLTVGGNAITLGSHALVAGKIYNVSRSVSAAPAWDGNLADIPNEVVDNSTVTVTNGMTIYNALSQKYKIIIADGATVTLNNVTINGTNNNSYQWAGITCAGDATIILKDGTTNTVKGFYEDYAGIYVPANKTLIIKGTGSLNASSNGFAAGIGGSAYGACGNIEIQNGTISAEGAPNAAGIGGGPFGNCGNISISGGTVTAAGFTGNAGGAGIGSSMQRTCGNITISGGTVTATGSDRVPGIGCGWMGNCGAITITNTVIKVTATKGNLSEENYNSIGKSPNSGTCGTVTIGGTVYWENAAYVNGGDAYLTQSSIIYQP